MGRRRCRGGCIGVASRKGLRRSLSIRCIALPRDECLSESRRWLHSVAEHTIRRCRNRWEHWTAKRSCIPSRPIRVPEARTQDLHWAWLLGTQSAHHCGRTLRQRRHSRQTEDKRTERPGRLSPDSLAALSTRFLVHPTRIHPPQTLVTLPRIATPIPGHGGAGGSPTRPRSVQDIPRPNKKAFVDKPTRKVSRKE